MALIQLLGRSAHKSYSHQEDVPVSRPPPEVRGYLQRVAAGAQGSTILPNGRGQVPGGAGTLKQFSKAETVM